MATIVPRVMDLSEARGRLERALVERTLALPKPILRKLAGPAIRSEEGYALDLETQMLLRLMKVARQPEMHRGGPKLARLHMDRSAKVAEPREGHALSVRDSRIPGPAGDVRVRIYTPPSNGSPRPILVYLHGGGFVVGSLSSHDGVCRALASRTEMVVVSVDYRLAPEHPFPHGLEDAVAVTRWVIEHAASFMGDPKRVAVGGDSAGGNLATGVALTCKDDPTPPAFQFLIYPATDASRSLPSHRQFREGFFLTEASIAWFLDAYLPNVPDREHPRASPLFADDLEGAPPGLLITAGFDPLRDEGRAYAKRLQEAGVRMELREYEGAIHGFVSMAGVLSIGSQALDDIASSLQRALSASAVADEAPLDRAAEA